MPERCVWIGDSLDVLKTIPDDSLDALVTDPPAGISFMGRTWDGDKGGRRQWIEAMAAIFREALRALKPGAHGLVWALPRTSHWTATALEDAGFEIRDSVHHVFGSGFPKSQDVSKAIDRMARRDYVLAALQLGLVIPDNNLHDWTKADHAPGDAWWERFKATLPADDWQRIERTVLVQVEKSAGWFTSKDIYSITSPASDGARQWQGYGTAVKPAHEVWWLVRKPLAETSIARNVLTYGTGGLHLDACRVGADPLTYRGNGIAPGSHNYIGQARKSEAAPKTVIGRWPPNCLWSHAEGCEPVGAVRVRASAPASGPTLTGSSSILSRGLFNGMTATAHHGDVDGFEQVARWQCVEGCPVAELDRQSGHSRSSGGGRCNGDKFGGGYAPPGTDSIGFGDKGGASRYFPTFAYVPKPSRTEKERGLTDLPDSTLNRVKAAGMERDPKWAPIQVKNSHPTVKSVSLMHWLVSLVTPPGGTVLDPFAGSGTTGVACAELGVGFIGIEREPQYAEIARARIAYAEQNPTVLRRATAITGPTPVLSGAVRRYPRRKRVSPAQLALTLVDGDLESRERQEQAG